MKFIFALLLLTAAAGNSLAEEHPVATLQALLDAFLAGASGADADMHERFWADDLVYTSAAGARFGKDEIMAGLAAADTATDPTPEYAAREVGIRVFGDTAVLTFTLVATSDEDEQRYYNSGMFRKRDGQWQAIVWQATRAGD